jgi:hypothetical protein
MAVRRYRTCSCLAVVALIVLASGGCGGGGDDERRNDDDLPSSQPTASTSPPTTTGEEAVRQAYEAFVAMVDRLTTTTLNPDDPELAERLVDPMLSATRSNLTTWRTEGQIWVQGDQNRHAIESIEIEGNMAYVTSCLVGNDVLVVAGAENVELPPPDAARDRTTMINHGGVWRVQYVDVLGNWEGRTECAA